MIFRSITEMKKHYLPEKYKKEQQDKMTPKEKGKQMAKETIDIIRGL